jgi:O-antigen/teichoic acid export membrane protein
VTMDPLQPTPDPPDGFRSPVPADAPAYGSRVSEESQANLDRKILRGSAWVALSYGGRQTLMLLSVLALVRLLDPKSFGLMALATTALLVLEAVHEAGLASALVYLRSNIERAAGTALVVSAASALALYGVAFGAAPLLADLFNAPPLTGILRVFAIVVVFRGAAIVPGAILERELDFRGRANAELLAAVAQVTLAIGLALAGAGVWSLVFAGLAQAATYTTVAWLIVPWRPSPRDAQWGALRQLWSYSWFMTAANVLVLANNTIDNVVVGRLLGTTKLGFYSVAFRVATMPDDVIGYIVGRVMFSVYSRLNHDREEFARIYLQNLQRIALLALPASVGVIVAAEPIVLGLLGEKWRPVVTPLRILAVFALVRVFVAPSGEVFKGAGKPHLLTLTGTLHLSLSIPCLLVLVPRYDLTGAALGMLAPMVLAGMVAFRLSIRLLGLDLRRIARALLPSYACAGILAVALLTLEPVTASLPPVPALIALVLAGVVVYAASTALFARSIVLPMWAGSRRA